MVAGVALLLAARGGASFINPLAYATITRYGTSPVLTRGGAGTWDHDTIAGEQVFRDARLSTWVMVYTGLDKPLGSGGITGVGLAYSTDLLTWTKEAANPVFVPNMTEEQIATANIVQVAGSLYRMYYQNFTTGTPAVDQIYAASSSDMLSWSRLNGGSVVLAPGSAGAWDSDVTFDPAPAIYGGVTYLYYGGQKDASGTITRGIGYATASDGITFTKYASNPILTPSGGESQINLGAPSIVGDATTFDMWYDSSVTPGTRFIDHAKTTDGGTTWSTVDHQFLGPSVSGWDDVQVFDAAAVVSNGVLYLFYAGSATTGGGVGLAPDIGLATMRWP